MTHITLNAIRAHFNSEDGWTWFLDRLGKTKADDEPMAMTAILDACGVDDANWCLRALGQEYHKLIVGLACDYVEMALEYVHLGESSPVECVRTVRLWIDGKATIADVKAAMDIAHAAAKKSIFAWLIAAEKMTLDEKEASRPVASAAALISTAAQSVARAALGHCWGAGGAAEASASAAVIAAGVDLRGRQSSRFREVMQD